MWLKMTRTMLLYRPTRSQLIIVCVMRIGSLLNIDDNGEVHVHTTEVSKDPNEKVFPDDTGDPHQDMMEVIQGHAPRPPDQDDFDWYQPVLRNAQDIDSMEPVENNGIEFEFATKDDSIMENLDDPLPPLRLEQVC